MKIKFRITPNLIRLIAIIFILCVIAFKVGHCAYAEYRHMAELRVLPYYELGTMCVVSHPDFPREPQFVIYLMANPDFISQDNLEEVLTDTYITKTTARAEEAMSAPVPTYVYIVYPTKEIPYGWEKDELNFSMNFDKAILNQNSICTVVVPPHAVTFSDCSIISNH